MKSSIGIVVIYVILVDILSHKKRLVINVGGVMMGLKDLVQTHYETSDRELDPKLQTHYYKNNYAQCKEVVLKAAKANDFKLAFEDDSRQELMLKRQDAEVIVSMVRISPIETALDFTVNTSGMISLGKGKKIIVTLYTELDKNLSLKGLALKR